MEEGAWICREERVLVEELKEGGEIVSGEQGVGRVSGRRSRIGRRRIEGKIKM